MKRVNNFIFLLFSLLFIFFSPFSQAFDCTSNIEVLPIQAHGRIKPLGVHAREEIKFIFGKIPEGGAALKYCKLSQFFLTGGEIDLDIRVEHIETKKFLNLPENATHISYKFFEENQAKILEQANAFKARNDKSAYARDLGTVLQRAEMLQKIMQGLDWTIPIIDPQANQAEVKTWISISDLKIALQNSGHASDIDTQAFAGGLMKYTETMGKLYQEKIDDSYLLELTYVRTHPFGWAILISLIALLVTAMTQNTKNFFLWVVVTISLVMQIAGVVMRVMISGRGPVTNMYETVMWVGLGAMIFSVFLTLLRKEKFFLLAGIFLNICCLFMMEFATGMLDPAIRPLVPVLRDNFWLSTHVTTITISYAAFALSWILANGYLTGSILKRVSSSQAVRAADLSYSAIKIGVVLLALGIILGGIWADYSWGRFWGWDPKETWALIALMFYIAILHGRYTGWIRPHLFLPLIALAFLGIIMAWFGVNYILATGLHSYGFSQGGAIFIFSIAALQFLIVGGYFLLRRS